MRGLLSTFALLALLPLSAHAGRETWEILGQVVPVDADSMNVRVSSSPSSQTSFSTLIVSTGSVAATAAVAIAARATRGSFILTNECVNAIRVGGSAVTTTVGQYVPAGATITLDSVLGPYRGVLYVVSTSGTCAWSSTEVLP